MVAKVCRALVRWRQCVSMVEEQQRSQTGLSEAKVPSQVSHGSRDRSDRSGMVANSRRYRGELLAMRRRGFGCRRTCITEKRSTAELGPTYVEFECKATTASHDRSQTQESRRGCDELGNETGGRDRKSEERRRERYDAKSAIAC